MFKLIYKRFQSSTFFERLLLIIGIAIGVVGFWMINRIYYQNPILSWNFLMTTFLWFLLIFVVILTDSNESVKEELGFIIREHIKETKLLREEVQIMTSI